LTCRSRVAQPVGPPPAADGVGAATACGDFDPAGTAEAEAAGDDKAGAEAVAAADETAELDGGADDDDPPDEHPAAAARTTPAAITPPSLSLNAAESNMNDHPFLARGKYRACPHPQSAAVRPPSHPLRRCLISGGWQEITGVLERENSVI
jgi:hypothetical protein